VGNVIIIVWAFATAWLVARISALVARRVLVYNDRRHSTAGVDLSGQMANIKRRETLVSVIRAGISYLAFAAAAVLSVAELSGGVDRLAALAGASFLLIVAGFSVQRLLMDIIAGLTMFLERWYSVGDSIAIPALEIQGIVEDVSLRHTKLRALTGEVIHVHNSQIPAVRVLPSGVRDLALNLFVTDAARGEALVHSVAQLMPEGPTTFVKRPWIESNQELGESLHRLTLRTTVARGSEWLAESHFADVLKERAPAELVAHGPVSFAADEGAVRTFARASARTRWNATAA
jgi:moderate conductance mechanosensitive channel